MLKPETLKRLLCGVLSQVTKSFDNNLKLTIDNMEQIIKIPETIAKPSEYSQEYGLAARPFTVKSLHIQGIAFLPFLKRF